MTQAIDEMLIAVRLISDNAPWGYDGDGICMGGVYLRQGETYSLSRPFERGVEYALIAGGDEDARDIDLEILDAAGKRIVGDTRADRIAVFKFVPDTTASYTIRLRLYRSAQPAFCSFAVLRRGGWDVPILNLDTARLTFLALCTGVVIKTEELGAQAGFLTRPHQVAVFGHVLRAGQTTSLRNVDLGDKPTFVLTTGDVNARDLDLYLQGPGGRIVASDEDPHAVALVPCLPAAGAKYTIQVANASRNGRAAFVLCGVLQAE